jgi:hypothetical protein
MLLRLTDPIPGLLAFFAYGGAERTTAALSGYLFSDDAPAYVEREAAAWQAWLERSAG